MSDDGQRSAVTRWMNHSRPDFRHAASPSGIHWVAFALVSLTGVIHLYVGWARAQPSLALAGLGFFGGIALCFAGYRRRLYALGIGYVAFQIVLWAVFNAGEYTFIGYLDKTVQGALLVVLVALLRSA